METEINTQKRFNSMKNMNVQDVPQFSAHRWEVLHSRRCCCTSQWPAPSGRCQHWATPGLRDAGWSGRRARRPRTGPPGWATTSPSGSWCYSWMRGRETHWDPGMCFRCGFAGESEQVLLFTEVAHHTPIRLRHREPFTVSWSDVDVDRTEVVVFLVAWETNANWLSYIIQTTLAAAAIARIESKNS